MNVVATSDSEVRFAHISDLHFGAATDEAVQRVIADVNASGARATVVTGDLTMRARPWQFESATEMLKQLPKPQLVIPGNHDIPLDRPFARFLRPYSRFMDAFGDELNPVLDLGAVRILGVNSMPRWRWKGGRISRRQLKLVDEVLGGASDRTARILAMHHPPLRGGTARIARQSSFIEALRRNKVDLVLAGHEHVPTIQPIGRATNGSRGLEVVAGTASSTRTRGGIERSWMLISATDTKLTVSERRDTMQGWTTVIEQVVER